MPTFIVLLGPPGAGKGTQAKIISEKMSLPHISSGDLFRDNMRNQTELGVQAKTFIDRGELVPDDLTIEMVKERLTRPDCAQGALLDGFPRTVEQARALDHMLEGLGHQVDIVPYISVAEDELVARLSARRTCALNPLHIYNLKFNPPKVDGICDFDGGELRQRVDDNEETVKNRIKVFFEQTMPLIDYYRSAGKLVEVDGHKAIDDVAAETLNYIGNLKS